MAAIALQFLNRSKSSPRSLHHVTRGDETEVVCGEIRKQRKADVRRRGTMRNSLRRIFLEIVGGKVIIDGTDKGFKELPGAARSNSKEKQIVCRQFRASGSNRTAQPPRNQGRRDPQA